MPQYVEVYGKTVEFPDGMTPAEITAAIRKSALTIAAKAPDPTEGMSGLDKFFAGTGKAFTDLGRGAGQLVGMVSADDVAESRKRDAALMNTGAGLAGNIAGNIVALAPTALIPGANTLGGAAAIGAATGMLQPATSLKEKAQDVALNAFASPAALLAGRGMSSAWNGIKGLTEPLTAAGQDRIATRVLQASATDPEQAAARAAAARELVPGSAPTVAQASQDSGLAQLERTLRNNPEYAAAFAQRDAAQRAARLKAVQDIAGTDAHYDAIKQGRALFAGEDYANAMKQGLDPKMAQALQPQIQSLLERPSVKAAQADARWLAAENGQKITDLGSVQGLDWLKKAIDNQISRASQPGSSIGDAKLRALVQTKNDLMATLEQVSPAYKAANDNYAAMSGQVNSMDVARSLLDKLQKPGSEYMGASAKEMGDAYARALSQAQDSVKKATGLNKTISDVMPTRDIAALEGVGYDLGRKAFAENAGKATGSNTAQNLISQNMLRRMIGPTGLPETWAESTMLQSLLSPVQIAGKVTGADKRVMDRIAHGLLSPEEAAKLLRMNSVNAPGLLGSPQAQRLMPGLGGLLAIQLEQQ